MRTTTSMIYRNMQYDLNKVNSDLNKVNKQISSGKQMSTISDNPANLVSALRLRTEDSTITQYQANLQYGQTMATASETALTQMKDLMMTANTLAIQANNDTLTATDRINMAVEVESLYEQAISLANTQISGKYIFGGFRTTGYTKTEPAPFIDGLASGYSVVGNSSQTTAAVLTATIGNSTDLAAGDLTINGEDIGPVDLDTPALTVNGLNMGGAANLQAAINTNSSSVTASLTTLSASGTAATAGTATTIDFNLNGVNINFDTSATPADDAVAAINAVSDQTGVKAVVGDGNNGGGVGEVVLMNVVAGDETDIVISGLSETGGTASTGLVDGSAAVLTSNTGTISLTSSNSFTLGSLNAGDDSVLALLGLDGGGIGFADEGGDGELIYGPQLGADDLAINGIQIGQAQPDSLSTAFADCSAAAKAAAINAANEQTGVTATITPALVQAEEAVAAGSLGNGDLVINGIDIFTTTTDINAGDSDNTLLNAINNQTALTGVTASRDSDGTLLLSATDGRNIQIETSTAGEKLSHLNGGSPAEAQNRVYFGSLLLNADSPFTLTTTPTASSYEPALDSLGLAGGTTNTGVSDDLAGDGVLKIASITSQDGNVRYAGDPDNDPTIRIGTTSTLTIGKNGQDAVMSTGIFSVLQNLKSALLGENYTTATGRQQAEDLTATLDSGNTGLEEKDGDSFQNGEFTVTVTDNAYNPPRDFSVTIAVDTAVDTLSSVAEKINGLPGISASWNSDNRLELSSDNPTRYTFAFSDDTSNFLELTGTSDEDLQSNALDNAIAETQDVQTSLTSRISDFGATYNRIDVQSQIYDDLKLATQENLSAKEDTDLVEAAMTLKAKSTALEAALSAASKVMELSLVDFL